LIIKEDLLAGLRLRLLGGRRRFRHLALACGKPRGDGFPLDESGFAGAHLRPAYGAFGEDATAIAAGDFGRAKISLRTPGHGLFRALKSF